MKVLVISRGNGFGHAKRDLLLAQALQGVGHEVSIASYVDGHAFLNMKYYGKLIDLELPAAGSGADGFTKFDHTHRIILELSVFLKVTHQRSKSQITSNKAIVIESNTVHSFASVDNKGINPITIELMHNDEFLFNISFQFKKVGLGLGRTKWNSSGSNNNLTITIQNLDNKINSSSAIEIGKADDGSVFFIVFSVIALNHDGALLNYTIFRVQ